MMFHTTVFILGFLPVCLTGFFTLGRFFNAVWALRWLTASSLLFYAWWNPEHVPLLAVSVALNHTIARKLRYTGRPGAWLAAGIALNLATLGWFKYADFLLHIVVPDAPALNITLPLAISFFTFQQIMFLVDTRRIAIETGTGDGGSSARHGLACATVAGRGGWGQRLANVGWARSATSCGASVGKVVGGRDKPGHDTEPRDAAQHDTAPHDAPPLLTYAAFVTFFPHLIAGPIVRLSEILPQLTAPNLARLRIDNLAEGLLIFLLGLGKKLVLADMFGGFADIGFDAAARGANLTFFEAWYATLAYALQIYFDFSGYSDMAIGLARMLNVRFPLNFDSPYQATDIAAFWRRWHITLGAFLRDYLYIPLGGNRAGTLRQTANLMATMLLAGLWHGGAWNFVIWGGLHGLFLVVHTLYRHLFRPMPAMIGQVVTLLAVIVAWVPFRAASLASTLSMLIGMAGLNGISLPRMIVSALPLFGTIAEPVTVLPYLGDARTLSFPEVSACLLLGWLIVLTLPNVHRMTSRTRHWTLTASFALSVQALFFAPHVAPFLYFQF
jgi:alginate O-acetyltransferase complex protein AlgI